MSPERNALLIATSNYSDPGLTRLRAPAGDAASFAEVLADPSIGGFTVSTLIDRPTDEVKEEIEGFFEDVRPDALLLLYLTGHGVLSKTRRLYFATTTTKLNRLRATSIEDGFVHDVMKQSRSRSILLVLDCCHSGAFAKGLVPKGSVGIDVEQRFEGQGRVILTASSELEYAFEDADADATLSELTTAPPGSLFTRYLVEGLKTGEGDVDSDGFISVDELYDYAYDRVRKRSTHQTPSRSTTGHGDLLIARNPHRASIPQDVRTAIDQALTNPWEAIREAAVKQLGDLRNTRDAPSAAAIDSALRRALSDEAPSVTAAAIKALGLGPQAEPETGMGLPQRLLQSDLGGAGRSSRSGVATPRRAGAKKKAAVQSLPAKPGRQSSSAPPHETVVLTRESVLELIERHSGITLSQVAAAYGGQDKEALAVLTNLRLDGLLEQRGQGWHRTHREGIGLKRRKELATGGSRLTPETGPDMAREQRPSINAVVPPSPTRVARQRRPASVRETVVLTRESVLELIERRSGITLPQVAAAYGVQQKEALAVLTDLRLDGVLEQRGQGWHATHRVGLGLKLTNQLAFSGSPFTRETALDLVRAQPGITLSEIEEVFRVRRRDAVELVTRMRHDGLIELRGSGLHPRRRVD
jgi:uncharacterized caspase-like protein